MGVKRRPDDRLAAKRTFLADRGKSVGLAWLSHGSGCSEFPAIRAGRLLAGSLLRQALSVPAVTLAA